MRSKHLITILCSVSLLLGGCGDFIKGEKAKPEVLEFSNEKLQCLQKAPEQLRKLTIGEASEQDISESFNCFRNALTYFKSKTYGSIPNAYTVDEMRNFFKKYFLKENTVTPEFAAQLMKIKRTLLGGSESYLTKDEIDGLIQLLAVVRDEAIHVSPHLKVLMMQSLKHDADWDQVSAATEQLRQGLQRLLDKTQIGKSDYSFEDAKNAATGLREFLKGEKPFAPYDRLGETIPLFESVKNVLFGRHAQLNQLAQWKESLNTLIDLYGLTLKYRYVITNLKFESPSDTRQIGQFVIQAMDLLENCQQMKNLGYIPKEEIDGLIDILSAKIEAVKDINAKTLKEIYRVILMRMLSPDREGDTRGFIGLEKKHLVSLRREVNIWRLHQSFNDYLKLDEKTQKISQENLLQEYSKFKSTYVIEKGLTDDPVEQHFLATAWQDVGALLHGPMLVNFNRSGRLIVATNPTLYDVSWKSLTKFNLMRAISRMLMLGYGENIKGPMNQARMTKAGLEQWYSDFNSIGTDLKAFDPRSLNSGARSFLEANFFTYSGNGDGWMSHNETFEFVSLLFSAGLSSSDAIRNDMKACEANRQDVFGYNYLDEDCFKNRLRKNFALYFDNLPRLHMYVAKMSNQEWEQYFTYLKAASVVQGQLPGFIETANIRTMTTIIHYVESIMIIYDTNKNQTLSLDEVNKAVPRFMSFIRGLSPIPLEYIAKEGFSYLVFEGAIPGASDIAIWQFKKPYANRQATRADIVRLFGVLKEQLNK